MEQQISKMVLSLFVCWMLS